MHILVITPGFPENEKDTSCIPPMQEYFRAILLKFPNIRISVVSVHYPYKCGKYNYYGIKVFSCGGRKASQPFRFLYWVKAVYYSLKINKINRIDIVHSFWLNETALVGNIVCKILNLKHINTLMGQDAKSSNKYFRLLPLGKILKIAVSEFQSEVFRNSSGENVNQVINWGVGEIENQNYQREYDVIGAGSLIPIKNYKLFIEIINELKKNFPFIKCLLIGEGPERNEIEDTIKRLGLINNITLAGHIKREEVLNSMRKSKIFLHTSEYESFGYVIAEALASGCFIVSRRTGCATVSEKIKIAETKNDFVIFISSILKMNASYIPHRPFKLEDTVDEYYRLYNNCLSAG